MALNLEQLREEALALPPDQQLELATSIYEHLEGFGFELHPDWLPELDRRSEEIRSGRSVLIPAEEVFRQIDSIVG